VHGSNIVFLPGEVAVQSIYADVQDLGIKRGELLAIAIERRQLLSSSRCPIQGMKTDDDILFPAKIAQPHANARLAFHRW
jgi:hypothetical protein